MIRLYNDSRLIFKGFEYEATGADIGYLDTLVERYLEKKRNILAANSRNTPSRTDKQVLYSQIFGQVSRVLDAGFGKGRMKVEVLPRSTRGNREPSFEEMSATISFHNVKLTESFKAGIGRLVSGRSHVTFLIDCWVKLTVTDGSIFSTEVKVKCEGSKKDSQIEFKIPVQWVDVLFKDNTIKCSRVPINQPRTVSYTIATSVEPSHDSNFSAVQASSAAQDIKAFIRKSQTDILSKAHRAVSEYLTERWSLDGKDIKVTVENFSETSLTRSGRFGVKVRIPSGGSYTVSVNVKAIATTYKLGSSHLDFYRTLKISAPPTAHVF